MGREAGFRLANRESRSSDFFELPGRVLVKQARDQRLIRQAFVASRYIAYA